MLRGLIGPLLIVAFCVGPPLPQQAAPGQAAPAPAAPDPAAGAPATPGPAAPAQETPSPKELLDAMARAYAECRTYQDTGTVVTRFIGDDGSHKLEIEFKTAFVRPAQFRFEFTTAFPPSQHIVWSKDGNVRVWWSIKGGEKPDSLGLALAGATGISMGAAHHVPALLLPEEVGGFVLTQLADPMSLEDVPSGTHPCHRIKGLYGKSSMTVWLDASTHLVLRLDTQTQFPTFRSEATTLYEPVLDGEVPETLLAFGATTR